MPTALLILSLVAVVSAQKMPLDALQILKATAQKYDQLRSYESSAIASRPFGKGLTLRTQLVFAYAGPSMTPATTSVPMIPLVTRMRSLDVFDKNGKSVDVNQSLDGPSPVFSFDQIASRVTSAKVVGNEVIDKHPCDIVEVQYEVTNRNPNHEPTRYWIDQFTKTIWKMQFSERHVLSSTHELVHWTVVWDSWTENRPPPPWALDAANRMLAAKAKTTLTGNHAPGVNGHALDGSPFELSKLRGSVVVLDFWTTSCAPCAEEMAALERLKRRCPVKQWRFGVLQKMIRLR